MPVVLSRLHLTLGLAPYGDSCGLPVVLSRLHCLEPDTLDTHLLWFAGSSKSITLSLGFSIHVSWLWFAGSSKSITLISWLMW